jgi:hypothetical protein
MVQSYGFHRCIKEAGDDSLSTIWLSVAKARAQREPAMREYNRGLLASLLERLISWQNLVYNFRVRSSGRP